MHIYVNCALQRRLSVLVLAALCTHVRTALLSLHMLRTLHVRSHYQYWQTYTVSTAEASVTLARARSAVASKSSSIIIEAMPDPGQSVVDGRFRLTLLMCHERGKRWRTS